MEIEKPRWDNREIEKQKQIESSIKEIEPDDDEIAKSEIELKPFNRVFESSSIASCPALESNFDMGWNRFFLDLNLIFGVDRLGPGLTE